MRGLNAAQHRRAGRLHCAGNADDLLFGLDAARSRDDAEVPAADLRARAIHRRVVGMELAVGGLVRLLDALDGLHDVQRLDEAGV